jgi:uncharacterized Zn finger protein
MRGHFPPMDPPDPDATGASRSPAPRVFAATLYCEVCGRLTPHRLLRTDPVRRGRAGSVRGTARCRVCQWTHRFETRPPGAVRVAQIVSAGENSERSAIELPARVRVQVGSGVPGSGGPFRIQRIDTRDGRQVPAASSNEVATLWVVRDVGAIVPVSIVEGRRTRTARLVVPRETPYEVGRRVTVEGALLTIVALRARGTTWRRPGDAFVAGEVQRIYGRRIESPPAGSKDWSRGRGTPRSFESSASRSPRSRSSPGARSTRTSPRARTAEGGATVQRSSPS